MCVWERERERERERESCIEMWWTQVTHQMWTDVCEEGRFVELDGSEADPHSLDMVLLAQERVV